MSRPYINHRLASLILLRDHHDDAEAGAEIERREKVRRTMDAALRRWPGFASEHDDVAERTATGERSAA